MEPILRAPQTATAKAGPIGVVNGSESLRHGRTRLRPRQRGLTKGRERVPRVELVQATKPAPTQLSILSLPMVACVLLAGLLFLNGEKVSQDGREPVLWEPLPFSASFSGSPAPASLLPVPAGPLLGEQNSNPNSNEQQQQQQQNSNSNWNPNSNSNAAQSGPFELENSIASDVNSAQSQRAGKL